MHHQTRNKQILELSAQVMEAHPKLFMSSGRDPTRINVVLEKLREVWKRNPDLRLAQLVVIAAGLTDWSNPDIFYLEDDALLSGLARIDTVATTSEVNSVKTNIPKIEHVDTQPLAITEILDAVYFDATREHVIEELESARRSVRYARTDFGSLKTQSVLPPKYREAYQQMANSLLRTEDAIQKALSENRELELEPQKALICHHDSPVAAEVVSDVRRTIEEINAAELRLVGHCESTKAALRERDVSGLIDWTGPIDYHFAVLLDPGPSRAFYESCGDGEESLRISLGHYSPFRLEEGETPRNWNVFEGRDGHPLQSDHHGYLVHCIIDHSVIPWQLISSIKEIEVTLEFCTTETAWERTSVSLTDKLDQSDEA